MQGNVKNMQDPTRDAPAVHTIEKDGFKVNFERKDPFGFFYMSVDGELPPKYKGSYTSYEACNQAANMYFLEMEQALKTLPTKKEKKVA
jgi:hypothetical protein